MLQTRGLRTEVREETRRGRWPLWVVVVLAGLVLVYETRDQWFGGDDWDIVVHRGVTTGPGHLGLFQPHYEHWSTVPILVFRGLFATVGLRTYWPYLAILLAVHLTIVVLLWQVMVRAGVDTWVATAACAVFAVLGTGYENLLRAWQMQLIAPLALGFGALVVIPHRGPFTRRDWIAVALLTVAVMCSGVAIPMLVVIGIVAWVQRGWRVAVGIVVLPAVLYLAWYLRYGVDAPSVTSPSPSSIPRFVWRGTTEAIGDLARVEVVGLLVVVAVVGWLLYALQQRDRARLTVPLALAFGGIVFLASTGLRRGNLFGAQPTTSRYEYVTLAFVLPLLAVAAQGLLSGGGARRTALVVLTAGLLVGQVAKLDHWAGLLRAGAQSDRGAVLATAVLARQGRGFLLQAPLFAFEPQVTVSDIVRFDQAGKLPALRDATLADRLTVLARLDLVVGTAGGAEGGGAPRLADVRYASTTAIAPGCLQITPHGDAELALLSSSPSVFRIRGDGLLRLHFREHGVDGDEVEWWLRPDQEQRVSSASTEGALVVTLPPDHRSVICGIAAP